MKQKAAITICLIFVLLATLFLPIPKGTLNDGGTRVYKSLTYTLVCWNKYLATPQNEQGTSSGYFYNNTSVFWFPDSAKDINELWHLESKYIGMTE